MSMSKRSGLRLSRTPRRTFEDAASRKKHELHTWPITPDSPRNTTQAQASGEKEISPTWATTTLNPRQTRTITRLAELNAADIKRHKSTMLPRNTTFWKRKTASVQPRCPRGCEDCKAGSSSDGGVTLGPDGLCHAYCSFGGFCGTSYLYGNSSIKEGYLCSGCSASSLASSLRNEKLFRRPRLRSSPRWFDQVGPRVIDVSYAKKKRAKQAEEERSIGEDPARLFLKKLYMFHDELLEWKEGSSVRVCHARSVLPEFYSRRMDVFYSATVTPVAQVVEDWVEFRIRIQAQRGPAQKFSVPCGLYLEVVLATSSAHTRCFVIPSDQVDEFRAGAFFPNVDEDVSVTIRILYRGYDAWFDDHDHDHDHDLYYRHRDNLMKGKRVFDGTLIKKVNIRLPSPLKPTRSFRCMGMFSCGYWQTNVVTKQWKWVLLRQFSHPMNTTARCGDGYNVVPKEDPRFVFIGDSLTRFQLSEDHLKEVFFDIQIEKRLDTELRSTVHQHMPGKWNTFGALELLRYLEKEKAQVEQRLAVFVLNAGIRDVARLNTFGDFMASASKLSKALRAIQATNGKWFTPVWRTTSAVHQSNFDHKFAEVVIYRNTLTELRGQVNAFLGGRIMRDSGFSVIDGYGPSFAAPRTMLLAGDIRHYSRESGGVYNVWTELLLSFCRKEW